MSDQSSLRDCPPHPHQHIHTDSQAPVSFPEFCWVFGFPVGPSGCGSLLLLYELLDQSGGLVQRGRASACTQTGQHPEGMLFAPQGYLCSVLDVCDSVSSVRVYSSHSPCEEPSHQCCSLLLAFLQHHPWLRLDLFFSHLHHHTQPHWPQAPATREALCSLAALWPRATLSPLSGWAWAHLLGCFVTDAPLAVIRAPLLPGRVSADRLNAVELSAITGIGPAYLDLPAGGTPNNTDGDSSQLSAGPRTILPPPHLPSPDDPTSHTLLGPPPGPSQPPQGSGPYTAPVRPINVVRHVRMPQPLVEAGPGSLTTVPSPLLKGRPVEVVLVTERDMMTDTASSSAQQPSSSSSTSTYKGIKGRKGRKWRK
ncbi:putative C-_U-editing enzyme APOBEC-4 [Engraulis encrasicolus]|uniref:putative C->U-editing enzyme APOBEC-4 n=1 Tax=Engraulis encrasicolus TaxID=184585 RepID=UPI002FD45BD3